MTHIPDEAVQAALDAVQGNIPPVMLEKALQASIPHLSAPCAVEVRGLIWKDLDNGGSICETDRKYSIDFWLREKVYVDTYTKMTRRKSLAEAKEAMQELFERFFLPYIITKPVDVAAVRRQAFEEAAQLAEKLDTVFDSKVGSHAASAIRALSAESAHSGRKYKLGDRLTKTKGSKWTGRVVGFYSTNLTPIGYAIESETETGSVQIYPEAALTLAHSVDAGRAALAQGGE